MASIKEPFTAEIFATSTKIRGLTARRSYSLIIAGSCQLKERLSADKTTFNTVALLKG